MSKTKAFPVLVDPGAAARRWDEGLSGADHLLGLRQMCDYGSSRFEQGDCDLLAIDCMPAEREHIIAYMVEAHPSVKFAFGSGKRVLSLAREQWRRAENP